MQHFKQSNMNKTKILVCGATGFIGRNITERLSQRDDMEIYGTYFNTKPDTALTKNKKITLRKVDLTQKSDVDSLVKDTDIIIQAAAVTSGSKDIVTKPYIHVTDNAVMNSLIFRAAYEYKVKHVIFFSCTTMYPNQRKPAREEDFTHTIIDKYFGVGWTKVYIEKMCEFYSRISHTKYTAIRHSNIYGPYDKYDLDRSHFVGASITKVLQAKGDTISIWGDGSEIRDLLYVSDLVDCVETIIKQQKVAFELINVGMGRGYSVKEVVHKIVKLSGNRLSLAFDKSKPTIKFNLTVDINRVRKKYGWKPKISLEKGIEKTIAWYKHHMV